MMIEPIAFRAEYDNADILEFLPPCRWQHVFRVFKEWANMDQCSGKLYAGGYRVRDDSGKIVKEYSGALIRTTGDRWQLPPTRLAAQFKTYLY